MRHCYHNTCDNFNRNNITNINYKFLTTITEAVILTVMELSASGRVSKTALGDCEVSLNKDRTDNNVYKFTHEEDNEVEGATNEKNSNFKDNDKPHDKYKAIKKKYFNLKHTTNVDEAMFQRTDDEKENDKDNEILDPSNHLSGIHSKSSTKAGTPIYSSGGGTQINIGNLNIALSLSKGDNLNPFTPSTKEYSRYDANSIPRISKQQPTYTNIIDYLLKKIHAANEDNYENQGLFAELGNNIPTNLYKEEKRNNVRKNSPMIVHILNEDEEKLYSMLNEVKDS